MTLFYIWRVALMSVVFPLTIVSVFMPPLLAACYVVLFFWLLAKKPLGKVFTFILWCTHVCTIWIVTVFALGIVEDAWHESGEMLARMRWDDPMRSALYNCLMYKFQDIQLVLLFITFGLMAYGVVKLKKDLWKIAFLAVTTGALLVTIVGYAGFLENIKRHQDIGVPSLLQPFCR